MSEQDDDDKQRPPAFQFYCRDWISSEKVHALSDRAFRAYVNLLAQAWLSTPIGTLPDDDRKLASMSRLSRQAWPTVKSQVLECFELREGRWEAPRLVLQFRSLKAHASARAAAGRRGGAKRWEKPDNQSGGDGKTDGNGMTKNGSASASASAHIKTTAVVDGKTGEPEPRGAERRLTVNCEICGWIEDHDRHTKCHYCWRVFTPKEKYGSSHRCP